MSERLGFPKLKISGTGTFKAPTAVALHKNAKPGDYIICDQASGMVGILDEWESPSLAILQTSDGIIKVSLPEYAESRHNGGSQRFQR